MAISIFWGDYEHDDQQDLLQAFEQLFLSRPDITDTEKLEAFEMHLKSGSVADQWWDDLGTKEKSTWSDFSLAFGARWPQNATISRSTWTTPAVVATHTESLAITTTNSITYTEEEVRDLLTSARLEGYEEGFEEGRDIGRTETEMLKEAETASCVDSSTQTTTCPVDAGTQTTPTTTADAVMQTAPNDKLPCLLNDAGTSTEPPSTREMAAQANDEPQPVPQPPVPHLEPPPSSTTSPLTTPAQPPSPLSTLSTTATTAPSPAPKQPPAPRERRHSLPVRLTVLLPTPQHLLSHPEPRLSTAMSQPPTTTTPATTTSKTTTWAMASAQMVTTTSEIDNPAANDAQKWSTPQQTETCDYARTRSSERVCCSTEHLCRPQDPQRNPGQLSTPLCTPLLAPRTHIVYLELSSAAATSCSTTPVPLVPPPSEQDPALSEQRNMRLDPAEHPWNLSQPPCSPQIPHKRADSMPPASSTAANAFEPPTVAVLQPPSPVPTPPSSVPPCSTPVPSRFDWAEDAASMPITPSPYSRDFSGLKTGRLQPFGTLQRRTRQRQALPYFFSSSRSFVRPVLPSLVQSQVFITRRHPSGIGPGKPTITVPFGTTAAPAPAPAPPVLNSNWDQDPRLMNLSQALRALGWIPPC
jgi:hypothetical protein